jgi:hypothetical protein
MTMFESDWGTMSEEHKEEAARSALLFEKIMEVVASHCPSVSDRTVALNGLTHTLANVILHCTVGTPKA